MTDATPDTRPLRCGGHPGFPAGVPIENGLRTCPGCPDCAPELYKNQPLESYVPPTPDTQSGGRPTETLATSRARTRVLSWYGTMRAGQMLDDVDAFEAAIRAESSAALQEARDEAQRQFEAYQDLGHELRLEGDRLDAAESTLAGLREQVAREREWRLAAQRHEDELGEQVEGLRAAAQEAYDYIGEYRHGKAKAALHAALNPPAATRPVEGEGKVADATD